MECMWKLQFWRFGNKELQPAGRVRERQVNSVSHGTAAAVPGSRGQVLRLHGVPAGAKPNDSTLHRLIVAAHQKRSRQRDKKAGAVAGLLAHGLEWERQARWAFRLGAPSEGASASPFYLPLGQF
eukprot:scaffold58300_cov26-Tisochrysis_lutea.AAC.1